jgi:acetoin utilization deacetylase AcuC-like enzyme
MATAVVYEPLYLEHFHPGHPEAPERLQAVLGAIAESGLWAKLLKLAAAPIGLDLLHRVHQPDYVNMVRRAAAGRKPGWLDSDTYVSRRSYDAALLAVGGLAALTAAVLRGEVSNGFALVRPPGHHASAGKGEGFCLFNNIAVAARLALDELGARRVLIVDWDVHHGQGTESIFMTDPDVLYCSIHEWGIYPGTGQWNDTGLGRGKGFTVNVPLESGHGDQTYLAVFDELLLPLARQFEPDLILVSAGFDAHWRDPLASMQVTASGFAAMTRRLLTLANEVCRGRLVLALEGGYDHDALSQGALAVLNTLLGKPYSDTLGPPPNRERQLDREYLAELRRLHGFIL